MSYAPNVTLEAFLPGLVIFVSYLFAGVPLIGLLLYRQYRVALAANQAVMRRVILLRCCTVIAFTPAFFMLEVIKTQIGSHVDYPNFVTLPQSAQSLITTLIPFVLALAVLAVCLLGITLWIEWREERAGRWPVRRQQTEDSSSTTNPVE